MSRSRQKPPPVGSRRHDFECCLTDEEYRTLQRKAEKNGRSVTKEVEVMIRGMISF